jgi:hypothetical protein
MMVDICWVYSYNVWDYDFILFCFSMNPMSITKVKKIVTFVDDIYTLHYSLIIDDQKTIKQTWLYFFSKTTPKKGRNV